MENSKLPSLNKVLIIGNLTKDPELRYTQAGVSVVNFKIASSKRYKDSLGTLREDVCHIGVVAWQKLAESCKDYLQKGSTVLIEGELRSRIKETSDGAKRNFVEIKAFHIQFLDRRGEMLNLEVGESLDLSSLETDHLPSIEEFSAKLESREEKDAR